MNLDICRVSQESVSSGPDATTDKRMSSHLDGSILGSAVKAVHHRFFSSRCSSEYFKNSATQTDYTEVECQTEPWEPPYRVAEGHDPEVLTLQSFAWGNELPAGVHEVEIINRMRMRRAWELVLPPMDTPCNVKKRKVIITALEEDEWAFRESEIQTVMDMRMELAKELMESRDGEKRSKAEIRFRRLEEILSRRRQKEAKNIRNKLARELRKLVGRHCDPGEKNSRHIPAKRGPSAEYHVKQCYDCNSRVDDIRGDNKPMDPDMLRVPKWLTDKLNDATRQSSGPCRRCPERKDRYLLRLSQAVEHHGKENLDGLSLLKRVKKPPSMPPTPQLSWRLSEHSENRADAAVEYLQGLISGRAVQCEFIEGKNRCAELIEELQASQAEETDEELAEKLRRKQEHERGVAQENRAREILQALEGKTIAKMLMFLNDELTRLESEKKSHALVLLAERERMRHKIEQACQEQLEANRRRELDEMYRQILKVNQESVQMYLEDVLKEGVEWASEKEAENYVHELANKVDAMAKYMDDNIDKIDEEGMVADMVYNFVLPRVAKEFAAREEREKQEGYLRAACAAVYDEIGKTDEAGVGASCQSASLLSCPVPL
ncbi:cilia- and flagella-associated protein 91-like [Copidosoma floridanum]|uniref:cilia- and flagella-associated protein 91-like n=1 Tax=Copidosoma floridanum TaxID=29053 RepID=UPI0006C9C4E5|nr:cilia- and flagella-associated protein 91-like [Copidosoma floridanum]